jgi:hypothetical protein
LSGPKLGVARTNTDAFQITKILVIAVSGPDGYRSVSSAVFTLLKVREYAV